jgi:hypothetical protein
MFLKEKKYQVSKYTFETYHSASDSIIIQESGAQTYKKERRNVNKTFPKRKKNKVSKLYFETYHTIQYHPRVPKPTKKQEETLIKCFLKKNFEGYFETYHHHSRVWSLNLQKSKKH